MLQGRDLEHDQREGGKPPHLIAKQLHDDIKLTRGRARSIEELQQMMTACWRHEVVQPAWAKYGKKAEVMHLA